MLQVKYIFSFNKTATFEKSHSKPQNPLAQNTEENKH